MMNRGFFSRSFSYKIHELFSPDYIMMYLRSMRKYSFYKGGRNAILSMFYKWRFLKLGYKLGFSIGENVFGYGLVLPHYGTIVIGNDNCIGNYAIIHTSTLIIQNGSTIGDGLFLGAGAKIINKVMIGENVWVGANSIVNKSFADNVMVAGIPSQVMRHIQRGWYQYLYSDTWYKRYLAVERLKPEYRIND